MADKTSLLVWRKRVCEIIEVGHDHDWTSRVYDLISALVIFVNLAVSILYTFDELRIQYGSVLLTIEAATVTFFAVDYLLRLWTAPILRPSLPAPKAVVKYALSFSGLVDLLSFLPYYLPVFFLPGLWPSACSGWYVFFACSESTPTTIR